MKVLSLVLALIMCFGLVGCTREKPERIPPSRSTDPILNFNNGTVTDEEIHTPVYVSIFGDTAFLSIYPREVDGDKKRECGTWDISKGGTINCNCAHIKEKPITRVVILDVIYPDSTADWFRNMASLRIIEGLGNLRVENVTDMSNMFNGCSSLAALGVDNWDVSNVTDMTGIFNGCDALATKPSWFQE